MKSAPIIPERQAICIGDKEARSHVAEGAEVSVHEPCCSSTSSGAKVDQPRLQGSVRHASAIRQMSVHEDLNGCKGAMMPPLTMKSRLGSSDMSLVDLDPCPMMGEARQGFICSIVSQHIDCIFVEDPNRYTPYPCHGPILPQHPRHPAVIF
jgi:hypothetical protein